MYITHILYITWKYLRRFEKNWKMESITFTNKLCLLFLVYLATLSGGNTQATSSYLPECNAWDNTIIQIKQSLSMIGGTVKTCSKSADCTGLSCNLKFWGKFMRIDMKLYPCVIPPQMRLVVSSTSVNFEQSVTHGDTIALPGFQYTPFLLMPAFKLAAVLVVHFEKVTTGMRVGLRLEARGFGTSIGWPIMPDTTVPTPPCPSAKPPVNAQCVKMDQLLATMQPPSGFICQSAAACHGFSCAGTIGLLGVLDYDLNATLVVNSCENPISYTVNLFSSQAGLNYQHKFTHTDTVPISSSGMPPGTTANLTVTLSPSLNLDAIDTSVRVDICVAPMTFLNPHKECHSSPLLVSQPVPIPPCDEPLPNPGAPQLQQVANNSPTTAVEAECAAWADIEKGMTSTVIPGYGFDQCDTNIGCMGMTCHALYETNNYRLYMELFHCANPVTLLLTVDSVEANFHYAHNITEGTTRVPVTGSVMITVRMTVVEGGVRLGGDLSSDLVPGIPVTIPVIRDKFVPTPSCNVSPGVGTISPGGGPISPGGGPILPGVGPTAINPTHKWQTKLPSYPSKPGSTNPKQLEADITTDYDNEAPKKDPLKQKGVNGLIVGVAVGFAAFFTVVVIGSIYYFSRRHARPRQADEVVLVGESGTSVA